MARNLIDAGYTKGDGQVTHHIVAIGAQRALAARTVIQEALGDESVPLDDEANGVFLNRGVHQHIHTNAYYRAVNDRLTALGANPSKQAVTDTLHEIRSEILQGTFPS